MPLKKPAPDFAELRVRLLNENSERALGVMMATDVEDDSYFHCEQLSHRAPPKDWSHEEWWMALKLRRVSQRRNLPLRDKTGMSFGVSLNDEILRLSEEIARRAGGTLRGGKGEMNRANSDTYLVRSLLEESIRSSQLEGASTSRRNAVELIDSGRKPRNNSETMILNNFMAMSDAKEASGRPLTPELVLDLHRILTEGTLDDPSQAGKLQGPEEVRVSVWAGQKCVHLPPDAIELPDRLGALCEFANGSADDDPYLPPVVRAIITHFMFGYDHYFEDGNGRSARIAFYWSMLHNGYWIAEFATISGILRNAPGKYGDVYEYSEDDDGDLTYFVLHQLRVFKRALDKLDEYIEEKRAENRRVQSALQGAAGQFNFRQTQIIETLSHGEETTLTARIVANRYQVTDQSARNDLKHLEELGLLVRLPMSRPAVWAATGDFAAKIGKLAAG